MVTDENVDDVFAHHAPLEEQLGAYVAIRQAGKTFARVILATTPACTDQQAAIRKVREAVMTANAAVALNGGV